MKYIVLIFSIFPASGFCQDLPGYEKLYKELKVVINNLPVDIHAAHKSYWQGGTGSVFVVLKNRLAQEYELLADKGKRKSALLNSYADQQRGNSGGEFFEPVNEEMHMLFLDGTNRFSNIIDEYMGHFSTRYTGKYSDGNYLVVWDSIYRSRRPYLQKCGDAILAMAKREIDLLNSQTHMLASNREPEKIQHLEGQAQVLTKLQSLAGILQLVVIEEGASRVEVCKESPGLCGRKK